MTIAMGAVAASLLWLIGLPFVTRRAIRQATADLLRRLPMSMADIKAQRDQLRVGHATELRRVERAQQVTQLRLAAAMADNGRHATRVVTMEDEAAAARERLAETRDDLAEARRATLAAEDTAGTQTTLLQEARGELALLRERLATSESRRAAMEQIALEHRATIAALETRVTGDDLRLRDAEARIAALAGECDAARTAMDGSIGDRDIARADGLLAAKARDGLRARVDTLAAALADLKNERDASRHALARAEQRMRVQATTIDGLSDRVMAQEAERDTLHRMLDEAATRRDTLQAERSRLLADRAASAATPCGVPDTGLPAQDQATRLRIAIAALAADLVAFATQPDSVPEARTIRVEDAPAA